MAQLQIVIENEIKRMSASQKEFHFFNSKSFLFAFNIGMAIYNWRVILILEDTKVKTELKDNLFQIAFSERWISVECCMVRGDIVL